MRVICWDFDGTLVLPRPHWTQSLHRALISVDDGAATAGRVEECAQEIYPWHSPDTDYTQIVGEKWWEFMNGRFCDCYLRCGVSKETALAAAKNVRRYLTDPAGYTLYEDAVIALRAAKERGYMNVLVSNNYPELEEKVLEALGLRGFFDAVLVSGVVGWNKPRRELFDLVRKRCPAEDYIMVGDNVLADVCGAKAASMKGVLVHRGSDSRADACFDNLKSVLDWMN